MEDGWEGGWKGGGSLSGFEFYFLVTLASLSLLTSETLPVFWVLVRGVAMAETGCLHPQTHGSYWLPEELVHGWQHVGWEGLGCWWDPGWGGLLAQCRGQRVG